jgi:phage protein D
MSTPAAQQVPDFDVTIDGAPLPARLRAAVTSVRFEEGLEGAGRVEVQFANQGLRLLEEPLLDLDRRLELRLGYRPSAMQGVFVGEITGVEPTFPASGMPTIALTALDATHRLSASRKERGFPANITDAAIATIVAAENHLIALPDPSAGRIGREEPRPRFQHKQSDHQFLQAIAAEHGFEMWVEGNFLNFRLLYPHLPAPEISLVWGRSLLEFTPRTTSIGQVVGVTFRVWVERLKLQLIADIGWDGNRLRFRVRPALYGDQFSTVEATLDLSGVPVDSPVDAIRYAIGELRRRLNSRLTARGTAIGDSRFRVGRLIEVSGVGRYSSSTYRLTSVTHTIGTGGYRTSFEVRKEIV